MQKTNPHPFITLGLLLLFAAGFTAAHAAEQLDLPATGKFILSADIGRNLLTQCSRPAPSGESFWKPSAADIVELEKALPGYLAVRGKAERTPPQGKYHRQYAGFVRHGKPFIYGSFYQFEPNETAKEETNPVIVCDGGPVFWGIVYDPVNHRFSELEFNGEA